VPKAKVSRAIRRICYNYYGQTIIDVAQGYNKFLTDIKKYSQKQLDLLDNGIPMSVEYNNANLNFKLNITNPEQDIWQVELGKGKWKVNYSDIKTGNRLYCYDIYDVVNAITKLTGTEKTVEQTEDFVLEYLNNRRKEIEVFEKKAKDLWNDTVAKYPNKIIVKNGKIIVKGKLKTYELKSKGNNDVGVYTYPDGNYICIHANDKQGRDLYYHDKLTQFALALINDSNLGRERISTLR
jgi:hypothetical protein